MNLPQAFISNNSKHFSQEEWNDFVHALTETEQPVTIRINPAKLPEGISGLSFATNGIRPVGWCQEGFYLDHRPQFTLDPLLHAGCYYVQEASSMFITHVLRTLVGPSSDALPLRVLDLCAAPGGKSTAALSALPPGTQLVSNEIDRKRARILAENIQKWGNPNVSVTANAPADFSKLRQFFDIIITDVPCSGEGMFRKDPGAIAEWTPGKVHECSALQRQILTDIWPCLKPGGLLVYSTCTFNVEEDEEQLQFLHDTFGAEILTIPTQPEWNIHPALCGDFAPIVTPASACRFMPHYTQGEGLFMAAVRKPDDGSLAAEPAYVCRTRNTDRKERDRSKGRKDATPADTTQRFLPDAHRPIHEALVAAGLYLLSSGVEVGETLQKGKTATLIPAHALALATEAPQQAAFPRCDLSLDQALSYLRREAITLPAEIPTGYILVCYQGHPLGFVKNIGNRSNNLYPTEWRIRNL